MFKSKVVAYVKPSSSCSVVLILGIGYGFLTIRLLSSLKSDIVRTVWSFFGMMKEGEAHLDDGCHFNTHINIRRSISFIRVALCIFGIRYGLPWYGLAPSFNLKETGSNFQSPSVPSKNSSKLRSNASSKLQCDVLRCVRLFFYNAWKVYFVILSIQNFHNAFGGVSCTRWFLGKAGVELKRPRNARFELQVVDIPHGQEDIINGDEPFFEVQHSAYIMQGLFAND